MARKKYMMNAMPNVAREKAPKHGGYIESIVDGAHGMSGKYINWSREPYSFGNLPYHPDGTVA